MERVTQSTCKHVQSISKHGSICLQEQIICEMHVIIMGQSVSMWSEWPLVPRKVLSHRFAFNSVLLYLVPLIIQNKSSLYCTNCFGADWHHELQPLLRRIKMSHRDRSMLVNAPVHKYNSLGEVPSQLDI